MFQYIIKRLALAIPTWLVISVVIFGLSRCATGDAVATKLGNGAESNASGRLSDAVYAETAHELGLDKPTFYFSILPAAFPDTFYKIVRRDEQLALEKLIWQYGNWSAISVFYNKNKAFLSKIGKYTVEARNPDIVGKGGVFQNNAQQLLIQHEDEAISFQINELKQLADTTAFKADVAEIAEAYSQIKLHPTLWRCYLPHFHWFGADNQYHHWLTQFLKGHFGFAKNSQSVADILKPALIITFVLGFFALVLAFSIGIPLGVFVATHRHQRSGRWVMRGIFAVYSLPAFWLATLALVFLTSGYSGFKIFPTAGLAHDVPSGATTWETLFWSAGHLVLPIICMALHPITVIARQTQGAIVEVLKKDYIQTARAKGLSQHIVIWHHAFRNALTPIITLLGQMIPSVITGAFSVELIFNLQGMGRTTLDAILGEDWVVVYAVLMLVSLLVLITNLVVDLLYRWFNPRIRFV
jgi:peptide/nickel transport system permease protein